MPKRIPLNLGQAIRIGRARHDMTIGQLAIAAGVSPKTIARTERGHTRPTPQTLARIAEALHSPDLLDRGIREECDVRR